MTRFSIAPLLMGAALFVACEDAPVALDTDLDPQFARGGVVQTTADVFALPSFAVIGSSTLRRSPQGLSFELSTSELGGVYTVWWVVVNSPENCISHPAGPCTLDEILSNVGIDSSIFFAAGGLMNGNRANQVFAGATTIGNTPTKPGQFLFGNGVVNPLTAEVHLVVRSHGPPSSNPGVLAEQLSTFNGGCPPFACDDVRASIHQAP